MRHFVADNAREYPLGAEGFALRLRDFGRYGKIFSRVGHIPYPAVVLFGDYLRVPGAFGCISKRQSTGRLRTLCARVSRRPLFCKKCSFPCIHYTNQNEVLQSTGASARNLLDHLLLSRGLSAPDHDAFLNPDFFRDSHDPFLLPDMEKAVDRVFSAKKNNEHVAVWSDYDADGIPGGVMLSSFLGTLGLRVTHYIPHRHAEGYGLNNEGLDELAGAGVTLVITVDLGTTELSPIARAQKKGIDVIVTDHHLEPEVLPEAFALINPKLQSSKYPFDGLCGAGVA